MKHTKHPTPTSWGQKQVCGACHEESISTRDARIDELIRALDGIWQSMDSKGVKCWCTYEKLMHPQDDPHDALDLEPNDHTLGCNVARKALREPDVLPRKKD